MRTAIKADRVYTYLLRGFETGRYPVGERIPTERDLADIFKVTRPTVAGAIEHLARSRLIHCTSRTGSIVINLTPPRPLVFGAIILDQARRPEESIFRVMAHEIKHHAVAGHSIVIFRDPSRVEDPNDPGLFARYRAVADEFVAHRVDGVLLMPQLILPNQYVSTTMGVAEKFNVAGIPVILIDGDVVRYPDRSHL